MEWKGHPSTEFGRGKMCSTPCTVEPKKTGRHAYREQSTGYDEQAIVRQAAIISLVVCGQAWMQRMYVSVCVCVCVCAWAAGIINLALSHYVSDGGGFELTVVATVAAVTCRSSSFCHNSSRSFSRFFTLHATCTRAHTHTHTHITMQ